MERAEVKVKTPNRAIVNASSLKHLNYLCFMRCAYGLNTILVNNRLEKVGAKQDLLEEVYFLLQVLDESCQFVRFDILEFYDEKRILRYRRTSIYVNLEVRKILYITQGEYDGPYDKDIEAMIKRKCSQIRAGFDEYSSAAMAGKPKIVIPPNDSVDIRRSKIFLICFSFLEFMYTMSEYQNDPFYSQETI